ncbi:ankyrin repeat protein [Cooperia oncophora]
MEGSIGLGMPTASTRPIEASKNIDLNACRTSFSHADSRSADSVAIMSKNDAIRQEYFKLKSQLNPGKVPRKEPNLLERKSTGQSNFYMLGRATRAVEMTRGGREGNNAFLKYESAAGSSFGGVEALIESGIGYKEIVKLSKEPNLDSSINVNGMDGMVVVAARMGLRELASALAEGPARCNMNDLHRETLKTGGTLPDRILGVSVLKKGFNNANITPLHTAAINPNVKILERLRTIEPNINIPDSNNWFTIHYAAVCEGPEPLKFLLKNGASPLALNKQHESPLHVAARAGRKETIKILLDAITNLEAPEKGAQGIKPEKSMINARTRQGDTALTLAVGSRGGSSRPQDGARRPSDVKHSQQTHPTDGHYGIVRWLLEEKSSLVDINGKDMDGVTLLSSLLRYANEDNHSELPEQIQYLLSRGADCSLADSMGNSIMHVFAGIKIRLRDPKDGRQDGMTENEYRQCFESIMKYGGNVESKNESGETPLHIALRSANLLLFQWMLEYVEDIRGVLGGSADCTLLHMLLVLPMHVWSNNSLWLEESPPSTHLYDVMPVINNILMAQTLQWRTFCMASAAELQRSSANSFTLQTHTPSSTNLYIVNLLRLRNVLALEGPDGFGFVISALKRDPNAARLILQTTKQHGCIDGVHNAVLRYETKPKENEEAKPVNKSLAMLFIEQKTFDLVQELQLTTAEWRHIDASSCSVRLSIDRPLIY